MALVTPDLDAPRHAHVTLVELLEAGRETAGKRLGSVVFFTCALSPGLKLAVGLGGWGELGASGGLERLGEINRVVGSAF